MIGILTEKPSAAKNFSKALGGMEGIYNGDNYLIVNARGHLYGYKMPEYQVSKELSDRYKNWDIDLLPWKETDFRWVREKKPDADSFINNIKAKLNNIDELVIATDVDPTGEGYLLAAEIIEELHLKYNKLSRMYFIDESPKEIQKAFKERKSIPSLQNDKEYKMATYRTRFDLMSMQFTRIAKSCGDGYSVLRQGRLKSAMVKITGDGLEALKSYKKVPYYQNRFKDENGNIFKNEEEAKYDDESQVPHVYEKTSVVVDSKEVKYTKPPKLLDLAGLSSILASKGIKAKTVLDTYQKMYDDQIVSYPRTEDKVISEEQFKELLPLIDRIAKVVGVNPSILTHRVARNSHVKNGGTHGANRPGINVPDTLDELKKYGSAAPLIYEILAKNYLSILAEDYKYEHQSGHLALCPKFKGYSNVPLDMGFKAVFDLEEDNNKNEEYQDSGKGLGKTASPFIFQGFPKKPPTPTMKWLMKQLEKYDVGTGATRTSIYADVTNENAKFPLLVENKGKLSMSKYGEMSFKLLPGTHIGDLKITEELQLDMKCIGSNEKNMDDCLHKMQQYVIDDIKVMKLNGSQLVKKDQEVISSIGKCPVCCADVIYGQYGAYCINKCGMSLAQVFGKKLTEKEVISLLNNKKTLVKNLKSSKGNKYDAYLTPKGVRKFKKNDGTDGFGWDFSVEYSNGN